MVQYSFYSVTVKTIVGEMRDLSDLGQEQSVGSRLAGASVTKIAELFNGLQATVSTVTAAWTSSSKRNSGNRNRKLIDRDREMKQILWPNNIRIPRQK